MHQFLEQEKILGSPRKKMTIFRKDFADDVMCVDEYYLSRTQIHCGHFSVSGKLRNTNVLAANLGLLSNIRRRTPAFFYRCGGSRISQTDRESRRLVGWGRRPAIRPILAECSRTLPDLPLCQRDRKIHLRTHTKTNS